MAVLSAVLRDRHKFEQYQSYIADCLQSISHNVAPVGHGEYVAKRWAEIRNPKPEEVRTPGQIIEHMKEKIKRLSSV